VWRALAFVLMLIDCEWGLVCCSVMTSRAVEGMPASAFMGLSGAHSVAI
jgi:hypothetical protein